MSHSRAKTSCRDLNLRITHPPAKGGPVCRPVCRAPGEVPGPPGWADLPGSPLTELASYCGSQTSTEGQERDRFTPGAVGWP